MQRAIIASGVVAKDGVHIRRRYPMHRMASQWVQLLAGGAFAAAAMISCGRLQIDETKGEPSPYLAPLPVIAFDSTPYRATEAEESEIAVLIERLTEIDKPDYGMAPLMSGSQFAPIKSSRESGVRIIMIDHGLETSVAVERLVELGPKAMPALLAALDDAAPSKLITEHSGGSGAMWYGREVAFNPVNPREERAKSAHPNILGAGRDFGGGPDDHIEKHEVTRGDICFVVIGQIVNRRYEAVRYQPSSCRIVNSPSHDNEIARVVRAIWEANDPAKMLFESLLADLYTRGGAARYQIGAAMRLLYYYPRESASLIAKRIDGLSVRNLRGSGDEGASREQYEANGGVSADDFIKAVAFSGEPAIVAAILGVIGRTNDPAVLSECLSEAVAKPNQALVLRKAAAILAVAPPPDQGPFGGEYSVLRASAALFPDEARPLFEGYLKHGTLACRRACVHALAEPAKGTPWAVEFLAPFLEDPTDTGWAYGPDYDRKPIRLCDEAAEMLGRRVPGAAFRLEGEEADLDKQIAVIRRRIAGDSVVEQAPAEPRIDFGALPSRQPIVSLEMNEAISTLHPFSDEKTIYAGLGYPARSWAYDTVAIDSATARIVGRVKLDEWKGGVNILRPVIGERALCYHPYSGGEVIVRDLRTGREIKRVTTPFTDGAPFDGALTVRNLRDIAVSADGRWLVALTPDDALHTVDLESGAHDIVWKREGKLKAGGSMSGSITPVQGTSRFLIEFSGENDPLRLWDQGARRMSEIFKVPRSGWREAWGRYACNHRNKDIVLWNLETWKPLTLPLPGGVALHQLLCDSDPSAVFAATMSGPVYVVDLKTMKPVARLEPPKTTGRVSLALSASSRLLFWSADLTRHDSKSGKPSNQKTQIAIFDVAELTR